MVWLHRSPIPVWGGGGVISSFKWFLPDFGSVEEGAGEVGTLRLKQAESTSKELIGRQEVQIVFYVAYFLWEERFRRLAEWWTSTKGPWHGRRAECHNLLQLCGQRPWISLLPDWQVRLGLNGIRVKTKITFFSFRKYFFYFLRDIAFEHCSETECVLEGIYVKRK